MKYEVDPSRTVPEPNGCFADGTICDNSDHSGWRHARSWEEIAEHLEAGAEVIDRDADRVTKVDVTRNVVYLEGDGEYHYQPPQILLEEVDLVLPATEDETDAALASIMQSFENRRLANPGDPLT